MPLKYEITIKADGFSDQLANPGSLEPAMITIEQAIATTLVELFDSVMINEVKVDVSDLEEADPVGSGFLAGLIKNEKNREP